MTSTEHVCPECGAHAGAKESGASLLVSCSQCGWQAATTNKNTPPHDPRRYTMFVTSELPAKDVAIRLAVALGRSSREMLRVASGQEPLVRDVDAVEVLRIAGLISPRGIAVHTEPDFPWDMPAVMPAG